MSGLESCLLSVLEAYLDPMLNIFTWRCLYPWESFGRRWSGICCNISIKEGLHGVLNSSEVILHEGQSFLLLGART